MDHIVPMIQRMTIASPRRATSAAVTTSAANISLHGNAVNSILTAEIAHRNHILNRQPLTVRTPTLEIAYEATGRQTALPVDPAARFPRRSTCLRRDARPARRSGCRVLAP